jgi:hypothetical protein
MVTGEQLMVTVVSRLFLLGMRNVSDRNCAMSKNLVEAEWGYTQQYNMAQAHCMLDN